MTRPSQIDGQFGREGLNHIIKMYPSGTHQLATRHSPPATGANRKTAVMMTTI